jgi:hypothetical protein
MRIAEEKRKVTGDGFSHPLERSLPRHSHSERSRGDASDVAVTDKVLPIRLRFSDSASRLEAHELRLRCHFGDWRLRGTSLAGSSPDHFMGSRPSGSISNASVLLIAFQYCYWRLPMPEPDHRRRCNTRSRTLAIILIYLTKRAVVSDSLVPAGLVT